MSESGTGARQRRRISSQSTPSTSPTALSDSGAGSRQRRRINSQSSPSPSLTSKISGRGARFRDWSILPEELIHIISEGVTEIEDFYSFRSVCKNWRRCAASPTHLPRQLPWMLLPYDPEGTVRRFLAVSTGKIYTFDLPEFGGHIVHGSPSGYLILSDESLSVSLLNPFTRHQIHLPSVISFLDEHAHFDLHSEAEEFSEHFHCYPFNSGSQLGVILVRDHSSQFLYRIEEDDTWTEPDETSWYFYFKDKIETVGYHAGRFYIVHERGTVATCVLGEEEPTLIPSLKVPINYDHCYLNTLGNDLLMVTITFNNDDKVERLDCFKLEEGQSTWSRIQEIGDRIEDYAVFVDSKHVIMTLAADKICRKRNCVYNGRFRRDKFKIETSLAHHLDVISIYEAMNSLHHFKDYPFCCHRLSCWFVPTL